MIHILSLDRLSKNIFSLGKISRICKVMSESSRFDQREAQARFFKNATPIIWTRNGLELLIHSGAWNKSSPDFLGLELNRLKGGEHSLFRVLDIYALSLSSFASTES